MLNVVTFLAYTKFTVLSAIGIFVVPVSRYLLLIGAVKTVAAMKTSKKYQLFDGLSEEEFTLLEKDCVKRGIKVPIEVDENGFVLDGHNRLKIAKKHDLKCRAVTRKFKDEKGKKEHVIMLNMARRHLKAHEWGLAFKKLIELRGVKRERGRPNAKDNSPKMGELSEEVGVPLKTAEKRLALADDYESLPEKEKAAVDAGEKSVASAARKQKQKKKRKEASETAKITGKFSVVYADPPWQYGSSSVTGGADQHYPTMPTKEICDLSVKNHATKDAVLFLWATNPLLPDALEVIRSWGFKYKTCLVWVKEKATAGLGEYIRGQHELLLIATRGTMIPDKADRPKSVITGGLREHSRKPDKVRLMIEKMYPDQAYLEMFVRGKTKKGWKGFGNELDEKT